MEDLSGKDSPRCKREINKLDRTEEYYKTGRI